jgi:hypothetical protein
MKSKIHNTIVTLASLALCALTLSSAHAQGTAFTYQGQLNSGASPANGIYDFEFSLSNAPSGGSQIGTTLTQSAIGVTNGLFTTTLNFGAVFTGNATWLSIGVRSNGVGSYTALTPPQEMTPTPYAMYAPNAGSAASVAAANITGVITLAQLPGAVVTNDDTNVTLVNLTLNSNLNLPSPATIDSGGSSLMHSDSLNNFYAGPGAGTLTNSGGGNMGVGYIALSNNTNGANNTAAGYRALANITSGNNNTAVGEQALYVNTNGTDNTGIGRHALNDSLNGSNNTAIGEEVLLNNTSGGQNTGVGASALDLSTSGSSNIALGYMAGVGFTGNESGNIDIGNAGAPADNNIIRIGNGQTNTFIAGVINGNGGGLTSLNASQLTSGAIPAARLPASVVTNDEGGVTLDNVIVGGSLTLPLPGMIDSGGVNILYEDGNGNFFAGSQAGNLSTSGIYNTATGANALQVDEGGSYNTANGDGSLTRNTSGNANTAMGLFTLYDNTSGSDNVAIGGAALQNSKTDNNLVAVGYQALENDAAFNNGKTSDGNGHNTAIGFQALQADTTGAGNTATGYETLSQNTTGLFNTAEGDNALHSNIFGAYNVALGTSALQNCQGDSNEVAVGYGALENDSAQNPFTGSETGENTAVGFKALQANTGGFGNTAVGFSALISGQLGFDNTAIGDNALNANTSGYENVAMGDNALGTNSSGYQNVAIGALALENIQAGNNNIAIGYYAGEYFNSGNNNIYIGNPGVDESGIIRIGENQSATYLTGTVHCAALISAAHTCTTITITGGSDLAEPFPISTAEPQVSEGAVMVIDETHPGQLKLADQPYDTRVAGVVSGANGIHPGIQMQQEGVLAGGRNVALSGRVYVQADASNGSIKPGDLLTTSSTPGRAMRVSDHLKAQGAILGKAMTGLDEGQGMVLVLVTLQ